MSEEPSRGPTSQECNSEQAHESQAQRRSSRASRSLSWSPEPVSNGTSSSALSSSEPRGSSCGSMNADDEDSQSCKDDLSSSKKGTSKKSLLSQARSLSATNIALGASQTGSCMGKIVGKATVIRRPSIARLKALFEKSDSDDLPGTDPGRKRPVLRSYSQRVAPHRPSVAQVPEVVKGAGQPPPISKHKPLVSKRKSLGPSARKAKEFRDQEKSQRVVCVEPNPAATKDEKSVQPTANSETRRLQASAQRGAYNGSGSNSARQSDTCGNWYKGGDAMERNVLYKSFSSSNLASLGLLTNSRQAPSMSQGKGPLQSDMATRYDKQLDLPPQLPTKKRAMQTLYAPIPYRSSESLKRSQTLPAPPRNGNETRVPPQKTSIYDFLPRKNADDPPRLPPKRMKPTRPQQQPVPLSALNNTYVNMPDMLLARNELMSRIGDSRYINVSVETKENLNQIEKTIRQHPRGAIIDLTSRESFDNNTTSVPRYEQVWDGQPMRHRSRCSKDNETTNMKSLNDRRAKSHGEPSQSIDSGILKSEKQTPASTVSTDKERSATLPSTFRTHDHIKDRNAPCQPEKQASSNILSDLDTSDICTTQDERSGTEYDTLFAESSDATETDEKGLSKGEDLGVHSPNELGSTMFQPLRFSKTAETEVKQPLPTYETIYPTHPAPRFASCFQTGTQSSNGRAGYSTYNPPPKPPRTFDYSNRYYDKGRLIVSVVSPKKSNFPESVYQVPPHPRVRSISRPCQGPPHEAVDFMSASMPTFGAVPLAPLYHTRQHVAAPSTHDYENVYATRSASSSEQGGFSGTKLVKHHSEYRPQGKATLQEPAGKPGGSLHHPKTLQHSFSDVSMYEALRGSLLQQQHQQDESFPQYAVVMKHKKQNRPSGQESRVAPIDVSSGSLSPSAPPRSRRHTPLEVPG